MFDVIGLIELIDNLNETVLNGICISTDVFALIQSYKSNTDFGDPSSILITFHLIYRRQILWSLCISEVPYDFREMTLCLSCQLFWLFS